MTLIKDAVRFRLLRLLEKNYFCNVYLGSFVVLSTLPFLENCWKNMHDGELSEKLRVVEVLKKSFNQGVSVGGYSSWK